MSDVEAPGAAGRVAAGRRAVALGEDAGAGRPGGDQETHHAPWRCTRYIDVTYIYIYIDIIIYIYT